MPLKIKFIKDDDEGILPYCEEEDAEKFYFQQILTARFSWGSNNYPAQNSFTAVADNATGSIKAGDTIAVTGTIKDANDTTKNVSIAMTYTYNGTSWERTDGSYPGVTIKVETVEYANEAAFITYLNSLTKKSEAVAMTFTEVTP